RMSTYDPKSEGLGGWGFVRDFRGKRRSRGGGRAALNPTGGSRQGSFDLALIRREPSIVNGGTRVWREPLVWVTATNLPLSKENVLPLVVAPAPCVYRRRAIGVLDKAGIAWRIAYSYSSLAGSLAAVRPRLRTTVPPRGMVPGH